MREIDWGMDPERVVIKPCPFCGAVPVLECDLRDWRGIPQYKESVTGYRPITYRLYADHRPLCYIRHMDGTNETGRMTASNWQCLVSYWNWRGE